MIVCSPTWVASGARNRLAVNRRAGASWTRRTEFVDECKAADEEGEREEKDVVHDAGCAAGA